MIGTLENATACLEGRVPLFSDLGSARNVYLVDGIIYKVEKGFDGDGANDDEYDRYNELRDVTLPSPLMLPEFYLYRIYGEPVIAMPYIAGEAMGDCFCSRDEKHFHCLPDNIRDRVRPFIGDTGGLNVIWDGVHYWLIDIEC